jgi:asparagine synthase (glutamine-hydrolysing)
MLNALFVALDGADKSGTTRATASMQRQGFVATASFDCKRDTLRAWAHPGQRDVADFAVRTPKGAAACVGPLWYRGQFGNAALKLLLDEYEASGLADETRLRGNFALFLCTPHQCLLFNDLLGLVRIYASADRLFYSTSWLATCAYAGRVELDTAAAVEYVLTGASHSDQTLARGITKLPLASMFDLTEKCVLARPRTWLNGPGAAPATLDSAVAQIGAHLHDVFTEAAAVFPTRTRMALSGGFDSRLILAGLLESGLRPDLFVYGNGASEDVLIARAVADSIGAPLEVIDKGALSQARPMPDLDRLVANALFFDGLPNDGIDDSGIDEQTRLAQTANGYLAMNGGGGEIFRNYFHLPNGRLSAMDIVRTFYRGFDRRVFWRRQDLSSYERRMATSILQAVAPNVEDIRQPLARECVELAYPLFRCHHWMGVNNSVATRHGYFTTPLIDPVSIGLAWRLPLAWKNAGLLESRLVKALHSGVAAHVSAQGFRFSEGPNTKARLVESLDCMRPVLVRPLLNVLGRHLRENTASRTASLARCRALLPGGWYMDEALNLTHLPDDRAISRALAVEIVCRRALA